MTLPGTPALVFLAYLLGFLPWAALRSANRLRPSEGPPINPPILPPRWRIWLSTLVQQAVLLVLALLVGSSFDYQPFALPPGGLGARELAAGAAALVAYFALRAVARAGTEVEDRRQMVLFRIAPRSPGEWGLWIATVLLASVAEEVAYRGVAMNILWFSLGNAWPAAMISSIAFAFAHAVQGRRSALIVLAMALVMHALVMVTKTLLVAMAVHVIYDLVAGALIAREARRLDAAARA